MDLLQLRATCKIITEKKDITTQLGAGKGYKNLENSQGPSNCSAGLLNQRRIIGAFRYSCDVRFPSRARICGLFWLGVKGNTRSLTEVARAIYVVLDETKSQGYKRPTQTNS